MKVPGEHDWSSAQSYRVSQVILEFAIQVEKETKVTAASVRIPNSVIERWKQNRGESSPSSERLVFLPLADMVALNGNDDLPHFSQDSVQGVISINGDPSPSTEEVTRTLVGNGASYPRHTIVFTASPESNDVKLENAADTTSAFAVTIDNSTGARWKLRSMALSVTSQASEDGDDEGVKLENGDI